MALGALVLLAAAPPALADGVDKGDVVAEGHIQVGSWTSSNFLSTASITNCAIEGIESFCFQDPPGGATLKTVTTTPSSSFNVDIWFHRSLDGPRMLLPFETFIGGCHEGSSELPGNDGDETGCVVPADAGWGTVDATWGHDLQVKLVVETPPPG